MADKNFYEILGRMLDDNRIVDEIRAVKGISGAKKTKSMKQLTGKYGIDNDDISDLLKMLDKVTQFQGELPWKPRY